MEDVAMCDGVAGIMAKSTCNKSLLSDDNTYTMTMFSVA